MNDPILTNLRQTFTPEYRDFVESEYTTEAARTLGGPAQLTAEQVSILENGFMLYLHFVLSDEELVKFLINYARIGTSTAQELVMVFKSTLPLELTVEHSLTVASLRKTETPIIADQEIAAMEAMLAQAPAVRTMATDMNMVREQGAGEYVSNQAALLQRDSAPTAPPTTPPIDPDEARWGSGNHY